MSITGVCAAPQAEQTGTRAPGVPPFMQPMFERFMQMFYGQQPPQVGSQNPMPSMSSQLTPPQFQQQVEQMQGLQSNVIDQMTVTAAPSRVMKRESGQDPMGQMPSLQQLPNIMNMMNSGAGIIPNWNPATMFQGMSGMGGLMGGMKSMDDTDAHVHEEATNGTDVDVNTRHKGGKGKGCGKK